MGKVNFACCSGYPVDEYSESQFTTFEPVPARNFFVSKLTISGLDESTGRAYSVSHKDGVVAVIFVVQEAVRVVKIESGQRLDFIDFDHALKNVMGDVFFEGYSVMAYTGLDQEDMKLYLQEKEDMWVDSHEEAHRLNNKYIHGLNQSFHDFKQSEVAA